jgi:hypothetical protein
MLLSGLAALVIGAVALPAAPALAWHTATECTMAGVIVQGTITFPAGSAPFSVTLQEKVGPSWQDVFMASQNISPGPSDTSASFSLMTLFADPEATSQRVINSATHEVSAAFPPCYPLD